VQPYRRELQTSLSDHARSLRAGFGREVAERWSQEQVQFGTDSRIAARRALYYVRLLEPDADARLLAHISAAVRRTLTSVRTVAPEERCGGRRGSCHYSGAYEHYEQLEGRWYAMIDRCSPSPHYQDLVPLEAELARFLRVSAPIDPGIRFTYATLPAVRAALLQHLGFLCGLVVAIAVLVGVEPVFSLFRNQPWFGAAALLFVAAPGILVSGVLQRLVRARGRTPFWDVGGRVARGVFPTALEPQPWVTWHPRNHDLVRRIYLGLGFKIVIYLVIWLVLGLVASALVTAFDLDAMLLTVYAIAAILVVLAFAGAAIDFADIHSQAPVRGLMLGGALIFLVLVVVTDNAAVLLAWPVLWALLVGWWAWRVRQTRVMSVVAAIALVMFVGLGMTSLRQAGDRWSAGDLPDRPVPLTLEDWPRGGTAGPPIVVLAASGGGSRAAIMTALTLHGLDSVLPDIGANLQAISSVSGGSLASAAYIAQRLRAIGAAHDEVRQCDEGIVERASRDFIYPTLRGVFLGSGRAQGIQSAWEQCPVGLGTLTVGRLNDLWRDSGVADPATVPFPVPIFNSVTLDRHAVAITPFDGGLFGAPFDAYARAADAGALPAPRAVTPGRARPDPWVYYRSGIYHLTDLIDGFDPSLSQAVRASANFPFGFPLVEVSTTRQLWYSPLARDRVEDSAKVVHLTDGGALSNSGLWPLLPLLLRSADAIRERGVLLIIVDAGRMPGVGARDRQRGLIGTILDKAPKSERLHLQMLEQLEQAYGECFAYVQIATPPLARYNIYTTWALDRGSQGLLDEAFRMSWDEARPLLEREYRALESAGRDRVCAGPLPTRTTRRVPLS
jgi:hypothetical protein